MRQLWLVILILLCLPAVTASASQAPAVGGLAAPPEEARIVRSTDDLARVSAEFCPLTDRQQTDLLYLLAQSTDSALTISAPLAASQTSRLVEVTVTSTPSRFIVRTISAPQPELGRVSVLKAPTYALARASAAGAVTVLGRQAEQLTVTDGSLSVTKDETAHFQYLDFADDSGRYVTKAVNHYGSLTLTPEATHWVKLENGDWQNIPKIGASVTVDYGQSATAAELAAHCADGRRHYQRLFSQIRLSGCTQLLPLLAPAQSHSTMP